MALKITILDENITKQVDGFAVLNDFEVRQQLLAEIIRAELMNLRTGNAHTKTRAEVRGGGKKPWKQKGTGRARHGSTRSPIWVGGGVNFGPRSTRNWHLKINKKAKISALKSILKDRLVGETVFQFPDKFSYSKTKEAVTVLSNLENKTGKQAHHAGLIYTVDDKTNLQGFVNSKAKLFNADNLKIHKLASVTNIILTPKATELLESKIA